MLGTSRCLPFQDQSEVRRVAVFNLVKRGIDRLIVIGGDGSLKGAHWKKHCLTFAGANVLSEEWPGHIEKLREEGKIDDKTAEAHKHLFIVGIPGSIDNDMVMTCPFFSKIFQWGTELTIGADTALHRVAEALNAISTTATSHQRIFVIEIMGRNCGYLALMSALCSGSDMVVSQGCFRVF